MRFQDELTNFAGGLNEAIAPPLIDRNQLSQVRNFLPAPDFITDLEKVKMRNKDLFRINDDSTNDDRLTGFDTLPEASWNLRTDLPAFDIVDKTVYYQNNLWNITDADNTAGTYKSLNIPHAAGFYESAGLARCKVGIHLKTELTIPAGTSLWASILLRQNGVTYDADYHSITATLYRADGVAYGNLSTSTYNAEIGAVNYVRAEFEFRNTGGVTFLQPGEYYIDFATPAVLGRHYVLAFGNNSRNFYGCAVMTGDVERARPLAEVHVFTKPGAASTGLSQSNVTMSATRMLSGKRSLLSWVDDVWSMPNNDIHYFTDGHGIYTVFDEYLITRTDNSPKRLTGQTYNSNLVAGVTPYELATVPKFLGTIREWLTHKDWLICSTNDGLAMMDPGGSDGVFQKPNHYLPDIKNRIDTTLTFWTGYTITGTAYTYTAATGVVNALTFTAGTFNDISAGDTLTDTSTGRATTVRKVNAAAGTFTLDTDLLLLDGGAFTVTKHADVYQPRVTALCVANISPGRIYGAIGKTLIWSGGDDIEEINDATQFLDFAYLEFGDGADEIIFMVYYRGLLFLFSKRGRLYSVVGEPPVDPTQGLGTIRPDDLGEVGEVTHLVSTKRGEIYFATKDKRGYTTQLWKIGGDRVPVRVDTKTLKNLRIAGLRYYDDDDQLWVYSEKHAIRSAYFTPTPDLNLLTEYAPAQSYVLDGKTDGWYSVVRPYDADVTANEPTTFVDGKTAWKLGCYVSDVLTSLTYKYYGKCQVAGDDGLIFYHSTTNLSEPINYSKLALVSTAYLVTKEFTFDEWAKRLRSQGQILFTILEGYFINGTTVTVSVLDADGTETTLATIAGARVFTNDDVLASAINPINMDQHILECAASDYTRSFRIKISLSGAYNDRLRKLGLDALVTGKKAVTA